MILPNKALSSACITLLTLMVLGPGCASNNEPAPRDVQCDNALKRAQARHQQLRTQLADTREGRIVVNLITAAGIEQQQARFIPCLERAQRALELMGPLSEVADDERTE